MPGFPPESGPVLIGHSRGIFTSSERQRRQPLAFIANPS